MSRDMDNFAWFLAGGWVAGLILAALVVSL